MGTHGNSWELKNIVGELSLLHSKRRGTAVFVLVAAAVFIWLVGCGGGGTAEPTAAGATEESASVVEATVAATAVDSPTATTAAVPTVVEATVTPPPELATAQAQLGATPAEPATAEVENETAEATPAAVTAEASSGTPTAVPTVNGIAATEFVILPESVQANIREIYARGQELGRDPHAFSKLGDSTIIKPQLLGLFDANAYNLGDYAFLQTTIDYYEGSFGRYGLASYEGLHSWSVFDPLWASQEWCEPNEDMVTCEFRYQNPSLFIIRLGSNDSGSPSGFRQNLREVVAFTLEQGVIPVLGTKADRFEGEGNVNNDIIREVATEYQVPLWDYDIVAETLPNRGLDPADNVHMVPRTLHDYTQRDAFTWGHPVQDLTLLMVLDAVRQVLE
jgi:hypothetical protein